MYAPDGGTAPVSPVKGSAGGFFHFQHNLIIYHLTGFYMEQNVQTWSNATHRIFTSVLVFSIGSIVAGLMAGFSFLWTFAAGGRFNAFTLLTWICALAVIAGYIIYISGLGNLRSLVEEKEGTALGQIRTGAIITIAAALFMALGVPGWINGILNFAAYIIMLVGFNTLKKSPGMPERARNGFSQLFISMLLAVISVGLSVIFGWIPVVGIGMSIIAGLLNLAAFVMIITGWASVKNSPAPIA